MNILKTIIPKSKLFLMSLVFLPNFAYGEEILIKCISNSDSNPIVLKYTDKFFQKKIEYREQIDWVEWCHPTGRINNFNDTGCDHIVESDYKKFGGACNILMMGGSCKYYQKKSFIDFITPTAETHNISHDGSRTKIIKYNCKFINRFEY